MTASSVFLPTANQRQLTFDLNPPAPFSHVSKLTPPLLLYVLVYNYYYEYGFKIDQCFIAFAFWRNNYTCVYSNVIFLHDSMLCTCVCVMFLSCANLW